MSTAVDTPRFVQRQADGCAAAAQPGARPYRLGAGEPVLRPVNTILTLVVVYLLYVMFPPLVKFLFIDAVWTGTDREACRADTAGIAIGACWAFIYDKINYFIYGSYPVAGALAGNIFFGCSSADRRRLAALARTAPRQGSRRVYLLRSSLPIVSCLSILLDGTAIAWLGPGSRCRLPYGAASSSPSWWRRSASCSRCPSASCWRSGGARKLPIVRMASVIFIEFVRGVPLITVLIMANTMLPLFLPGDMTVDRLLRPLDRHRPLRLRLHGRGGARRPAGDAEGPV